jgi:hypothetical protein
VGLANGFVHGPELEKSRHHCPAKTPLNPTAQLLAQRGELALMSALAREFAIALVCYNIEQLRKITL